MKLKLWRSLLLGLFLSNAPALPAQSQINPDGTTNTTVNFTNNTISINEGDRAGDNLFHSFERFSVPNGSEAFFNNPNEIVNIFSRVTGGSISEIEGLIGANGEANLFLINPAGIVFGEGAALDIGGSFTASTADSIVFADDVEFTATNSDNPPLLTVNMPIGLNYGNNPGSIAVNNSNLAVDSGATLSLLGGDVVITGGQIIAPGGNIFLGGVSQAGQISFTQSENTFNSFNFSEGIARGDVTLNKGAEVNVRAAGGGNIRVNARNLELFGGELGASNIIAGIASESDSVEAQAGDIAIDVTENLTIDRGSVIRNSIEAEGIGNSGEIDITTTNLKLTEGGQVNTNTSGRGDTGTISITSNSIEADGSNSGIFNQVEAERIGNSGGIDITTTNLELTRDAKVDASTFGVGDAGGIDITTTNLKLTEGGQVNASSIFGRGDGGEINIQASDTIEADGEGPDELSSGILSLIIGSAMGNSGGINITTANLKLTRGAEVNASSLNGSQGDAGSINIQASDTIEADGEGLDGIGSGIFSLVEAVGTGNPSSIDITTTNLKLTDRAKIDASIRFGERDSGGINITTANLYLIEGAQINASTFDRGNAGAIIVRASDTIEADGAAQDGSSGIFNRVEQSAVGNAGAINITTSNLKLTDGAEVNASTFSVGDAGTINIQASDTIEADGKGEDELSSGIFSTANTVGVGNGGGINITTSNLKLTDGAEVNASTFFGQKDLGGINITTANISLTQGAEINASTLGQGDGGKIIVRASDTIEADGKGEDGFSSGIFNIVEGSAVGNAGGIDITTDNLYLTDGGQVNASTFGVGDAGAIIVRASDTIEADGEAEDGFSSGILSTVEESAAGNAGGINITTANLKLTDGAEVNASTFGVGDAGAIVVRASDTIEADGEGEDGFNSGIFSVVDTLGIGNAGGIDITAANLRLTGGAQVNASTFFGERDAGGIKIVTSNLFLGAGGQISASTFGLGNGGAILIQASNTIEANGEGQDEFITGIFSQPDQLSIGNAGGIEIDTSNLSIANGARFSVQSQGQGNAGDLSIQADAVALSNEAALFASTITGTGGNINLQIAGNLILRNNSTISARALEDANGGNIDLEADFAIAFPNQNNDIVALAASGTGGNINITTNALFGLEERSSLPVNDTNDIDASSEFGLDGTIEINELDFNPIEALEELPVEVIDVAGLVEQNLCQQGRGSEFVVTGKGGTAISPARARDGSISEVDLVKPAPFVEDSIGEVKQDEPEIIEAQGWVVNDRGMVELVTRKTDIGVSLVRSQARCDR